MVVVEPDKLPSPKEVGSSSHPPSPRRPAHARRLSLAQRELALGLAQREICAATRPGNRLKKVIFAPSAGVVLGFCAAATPGARPGCVCS